MAHQSLPGDGRGDILRRLRRPGDRVRAARAGRVVEASTPGNRSSDFGGFRRTDRGSAVLRVAGREDRQNSLGNLRHGAFFRHEPPGGAGVESEFAARVPNDSGPWTGG